MTFPSVLSLSEYIHIYVYTNVSVGVSQGFGVLSPQIDLTSEFTSRLEFTCRSAFNSARSRFMITTAPAPRPAAVPLGDRVCLPITSTWPIASTLADLAKFGWSFMSTLADQIHLGCSVSLWSLRFTLADKVYFGRPGSLWPIRFTGAGELLFSGDPKV